MRKLMMRITWVVLFLFAGLPTWNVGAANLTGALTTGSSTNHSLIEKVACFNQGFFCPPGLVWRHGECIPCPFVIRCAYPKCVVRTPDGYACKNLDGVPPHACPIPMWRR